MQQHNHRRAVRGRALGSGVPFWFPVPAQDRRHVVSVLCSSSLLHSSKCQHINRDALPHGNALTASSWAGHSHTAAHCTPCLCSRVSRSPTRRQCYPLLGKNATAGSEGDAAAQQVVVPISSGSAALGNGQRTEATNSTQATPEVRSCPPGATAVGSLCVRSSAGSRKGVAGTLAASAALLAAWQLAVVLVTSLLAC